MYQFLTAIFYGWDSDLTVRVHPGVPDNLLPTASSTNESKGSKNIVDWQPVNTNKQKTSAGTNPDRGAVL